MTPELSMRLSAQCRDGFDLDQLIGVTEHRNAEQCARGIVLAEVPPDDLPRRHEIFSLLRRDVHRRLDDIGELGTSCTKSDLEVRHDLLGLRFDVSGSHDPARGVKRARACE